MTNFAGAYLAGLFSNYCCPCGFYFGLDGIKEAKEHFELGHYDTASATPNSGGRE